MKKMILLSCNIALIGMFSVSLASNPGDVTLVNSNQTIFGGNNNLQFQLITNGNGLVTSGVLSAFPPDNIQTLDHWDFSDQTNRFTIYIRNVSGAPSDFIPCSNEIAYNQTQAPLTIYGAIDGVNVECKIQSVNHA